MLRLLVAVAVIACTAGASTCNDNRAATWSGMADMMSAAPLFMQPAINSVCTKAAAQVPSKLPSTCAKTTAHIREATPMGCYAVFAALSSAATAGDCLCLAVIAFADAVEGVKALHAEPKAEVHRASDGLQALLLLAGVGAVGIGAMVRRANHRQALV